MAFVVFLGFLCNNVLVVSWSLRPALHHTKVVKDLLGLFLVVLKDFSRSFLSILFFALIDLAFDVFHNLFVANFLLQFWNEKENINKLN